MIYWLLFLAYAALLILSLFSIFRVSVFVGVVCLLFIFAGVVMAYYIQRFWTKWALGRDFSRRMTENK